MKLILHVGQMINEVKRYSTTYSATQTYPDYDERPISSLYHDAAVEWGESIIKDSEGGKVADFVIAMMDVGVSWFHVKPLMRYFIGADKEIQLKTVASAVPLLRDAIFTCPQDPKFKEDVTRILESEMWRYADE